MAQLNQAPSTQLGGRRARPRGLPGYFDGGDSAANNTEGAFAATINEEIVADDYLLGQFRSQHAG